MVQGTSEEKNFTLLLSLLSEELAEAKIKRFRIIILTKEVSKPTTFNFFQWFNLMEQVLIKFTKLREENCKMYGSKINREQGSGMELNLVFKAIKWN